MRVPAWPLSLFSSLAHFSRLAHGSLGLDHKFFAFTAPSCAPDVANRGKKGSSYKRGGFLGCLDPAEADSLLIAGVPVLSILHPLLDSKAEHSCIC